MMGAKVLTVVTETVLLGDAIRESKSCLAHAAAAALRRVYSQRLHLYSITANLQTFLHPQAIQTHSHNC